MLEAEVEEVVKLILESCNCGRTEHSTWLLESQTKTAWLSDSQKVQVKVKFFSPERPEEKTTAAMAAMDTVEEEQGPPLTMEDKLAEKMAPMVETTKILLEERDQGSM